jgi:hypothetical protein
MTTGCASSAPRSAPVAAAPRVPPRPDAKVSCALYTLPSDKAATRADIEIGYATRGLQVLECDGKRLLANAALTEQHTALDKWEQDRADRRCPVWKVWGCKPPN